MTLENKYTITWDEVEIMHPDAGGGSVYYYQGKPFTGILIEYHSNGYLIGEIEVVNSHTHGRVRLFYENGQLKEDYFQKYNRMYGFYKQWDENGILTASEDYGPEPENEPA